MYWPAILAVAAAAALAPAGAAHAETGNLSGEIDEDLLKDLLRAEPVRTFTEAWPDWTGFLGTGGTYHLIGGGPDSPQTGWLLVWYDGDNKITKKNYACTTKNPGGEDTIVEYTERIGKVLRTECPGIDAKPAGGKKPADGPDAKPGDDPEAKPGDDPEAKPDARPRGAADYVAPRDHPDALPSPDGILDTRIAKVFARANPGYDMRHNVITGEGAATEHLLMVSSSRLLSLAMAGGEITSREYTCTDAEERYMSFYKGLPANMRAGCSPSSDLESNPMNAVMRSGAAPAGLLSTIASLESVAAYAQEHAEYEVTVFPTSRLYLEAMSPEQLNPISPDGAGWILSTPGTSLTVLYDFGLGVTSEAYSCYLGPGLGWAEHVGDVADAVASECGEPRDPVTEDPAVPDEPAWPGTPLGISVYDSLPADVESHIGHLESVRAFGQANPEHLVRVEQEGPHYTVDLDADADLDGATDRRLTVLYALGDLGAGEISETYACNTPTESHYFVEGVAAAVRAGCPG